MKKCSCVSKDMDHEQNQRLLGEYGSLISRDAEERDCLSSD